MLYDINDDKNNIHRERTNNARDFLCLIGPLMQPRTTWEHALPIIISIAMVICTIIMMGIAIAKF